MGGSDAVIKLTRRWVIHNGIQIQRRSMEEDARGGLVQFQRSRCVRSFRGGYRRARQGCLRCTYRAHTGLHGWCYSYLGRSYRGKTTVPTGWARRVHLGVHPCDSRGVGIRIRSRGLGDVTDE